MEAKRRPKRGQEAQKVSKNYRSDRKGVAMVVIQWADARDRHRAGGETVRSICCARIFCRNFLQEFPAIFSCRNFLQKFPAGISCRNCLQEFPARSSCKNLLQELPARISCRNSLQEFPARISCRNFLQEFPARTREAIGVHRKNLASNAFRSLNCVDFWQEFCDFWTQNRLESGLGDQIRPKRRPDSVQRALGASKVAPRRRT